MGQSRWKHACIAQEELKMIALIDSGVNLSMVRSRCNIKGLNIELIEGNLHINNDFVDNQDHGTNVLNILNEVSADKDYLVIKILDCHLRATLPQLVEGIKTAIKWKARIINISCGDTIDSLDLQNITKQCYQNGIVIVSSISQYYRSFPASYPWVIGVNSQTGSKVPELSYAENNHAGFIIKWGTEVKINGHTRIVPQPASYACPIITGLVSRIIAKSPNADVDQVRHDLIKIIECGRALNIPVNSESEIAASRIKQ